ncbi:MAG: LacI family DNA-binding transcriptional regulator [Ignavibacteriales bacterium]|nr:MAG: LacI family DNA-binding transcriptional regulator [Ignavibacteriales bacterium]
MSVREIAKRAKVSIGTVDRVLHNRGRVSPETKAKIEKIIKELNYKPNFFAKNLSLGKTYRFGVLMPKLSQDSNYWRLPAEGINRAQNDLQTYKIKIQFYHYDRYSEESFRVAFKKVLRENLDGLLIAPVLSAAASEMINTIPDSIPYVFFDSTVPDSKPLTVIGQDYFQSGVLAAKLMRLLLKDEGCIAAIKILPEDYHINERIRGFISSISSKKNCGTKIYELDSNPKESELKNLCNRILSENKNLSGIFVSNAWTYLFAEFARSLKSRPKIHVIGYDLIKKNVEYIENETIDFVISQSPEIQGYSGINTLFKHVVLKEKVNKKILVPLDIFTKENIRYKFN